MDNFHFKSTSWIAYDLLTISVAWPCINSQEESIYLVDVIVDFDLDSLLDLVLNMFTVSPILT